MELQADEAAVVKKKPAKKKPRKPQEAATEQEVHNGNGTLQEPTFDIDRLYELLGALDPDYLAKNFTEQRLRALCESMKGTLDRCSKRLQTMENTRTAMLCDHCKKPLPRGHFVGEIVIRDEITNELKALRACGESCYREISRVANERRQRHQGSIRGTVAM